MRKGLNVHTHANLNAGRSMLEMLGVLAVIGVLSIGGLAGYKIAMNYHRANETIHDVMLRATNVPMKWEDYLSRKGSNDEFEFPDLGTYETKNAVGYTGKLDRSQRIQYMLLERLCLLSGLYPLPRG